MKSTTELSLGPARGADLPRIAALSRNEIEVGLAPAWTIARLDRSRRDRETMMLVARLRGVPATEAFAGFAIMSFGDARAHLALLAVEPRLRRRGIARRMLEWLEQSALEAGTFDLTLEVRATNPGAQAFYLACGYEVAGRVSRYYQGAEDAIRMRRDLRVRGAN